MKEFAWRCVIHGNPRVDDVCRDVVILVVSGGAQGVLGVVSRVVSDVARVKKS